MSGKNPTHPGQAVTHTTGGGVGITTAEPRKRSANIGVMWIGGSYSVLENPADLTVIPADLVLSIIARA